MTAVTFGSLVGAEPDLEDAREFLDFWFEPEDLVCFALMKGRRTEHRYAAIGEFLQDLDTEAFAEVSRSRQLYFALAPCVEERYKETTGQPVFGGNSNLKNVIGLYADLDIKDGGFESQKEILEFLAGLELQPSVIVDSGSGGIHAYFKLEERAEVNDARKLQEGWWLYLNEQAGDRSIDGLKDVSRILRVPGSLRHSKPDEPPGAGLVKLLGGSGATVSAEDVSALSKHLVKAHSRKMAARRGRERPVPDDLSRIDEVEWEEILDLAGWSFLRTDYDDRDLWVRPGSTQKSAAVNWPESPGVMSLLSGSPETGLLDLKEAGIALTKYRVALRLLAGDDREVLSEVLNTLGK